jgi:hypothetical protein
MIMIFMGVGFRQEGIRIVTSKRTGLQLAGVSGIQKRLHDELKAPIKGAFKTTHSPTAMPLSSHKKYNIYLPPA